MKILIPILLLPVLVLAAVRFELTPWRLLSSAEYAAMQQEQATLKTQVATLQDEVKKLDTQLKQQVAAPKISDGSWMRDAGKGSALQKR